MKIQIVNTIKRAMRLGFFHLLSANIFLQITGFGMQLFLTNFLEPADIGRIRVLQSFISVAVIFAGVGLNTAVLKYCSEDIEDNERKRIFINSFKLSILTSFITLLIMLGLSFFNLYSRDPITSGAIKLYLAIIPFSVLNSLILAYLQAQKKVKEMSRMQILVKCINIILVVIMVILFKFPGYVYGMILGTSLDVLAFTIFLKDEIKLYHQVPLIKSYVHRLFYLGKFGFLTNALGQLIASTDVIMLNYLVGDSAKIGFYGTAQLVILGIRLIPATLNQLVIPYISSNAGNIEKVKKIFTEYRNKTVIIMTGLTVLAYLCGPWGIRFLFGNRYNEAIPFFQVLLIGLFFWSIYAPKGIVLLGLGYVQYNFYSSVVVQFCNTILNYFCITRFGAIGAAYATTISYVLGIFVTGYYYKKALERGPA